MNTEVPYLVKVGNLHKVLDAIQRAGAPDVFSIEFLKDLGFTSSQDRPTPKLLKYLGLLDSSGRPTAQYREFMDQTQAKQVLAIRMREAFDDLFKADKNAHQKSVEQLKGWFKTKTGVGEAVAAKMASTFKALASYADFNAPEKTPAPEQAHEHGGAPADDTPATEPSTTSSAKGAHPATGSARSQIGLVYRFEIHLPDTQNVDTFRAIFRALREELM